MRRPLQSRRGPLLLALLLAAPPVAPVARARTTRQEEVPREPQMLRLKVSDPYLAFEAMGDRLDIRYDEGGGVRDDTQEYTPSAGFNLSGSVYHPRLLQFQTAFEQGYTWGERTVTGADTEDRTFNLTRFNGSATVLAEKPYNVTLFGLKNRSERTYDRFNRYTVDAEQYGAQNHFEQGPWRVSLRGQRDEERYSGSDRPGFWNQSTFDLDVLRERATTGQSTLRYTFEDYERADETLRYDGTRQQLLLQDEYHFGLKERGRLLSTLNWNDARNDYVSSESLSLREDLRVRSRPSWWNGATLRAETRDNDGASSDLLFGRAYTEHQFYQSIHSELDFEAERGRYDDEGSGEDYTRFGPGVTEHYTKKLGAPHRLTIDLGLRYEQEHLGSSGDAATVVGEPLTLTDTRPAFLRLPRAEPGSVVVRDAGGARLYIEGIDYVVEQRGEYLQIRRLVGGAIPPDSTVLVDYRAGTSSSSDIARVERRNGIRLDLFERLLALYADQRVSDSSGGDSIRFQDQADLVAGLKAHYRWIDAGAEWFQHDSESLGYSGRTVFLDLTWQFEASSLVLHAGRTTTDYDDTGDRQDSETYSAQYEFRPVPRWAFQLYAAEYREGGDSSDRELQTAEVRSQFAYGRLSLDATYRIEREDAGTEDRDRDYFLVRVKRLL